jgi:hypothetical protein
MKERYEEIVSEVITFEKADVITTSGDSDNKYSIGSGGGYMPAP